MNLKHVAIIMDGNGRFAKLLGKIRSYGHLQGAKKIKKVIEYAINDNIKVLSLFAFSTENWNRPIDEVNYLIDLLTKYVLSSKVYEFCNKYQIRFLWKGFKNKLSNDLLLAIHRLEKQTQNNEQLTLAIMFNYGGQDEIINAINLAVENKTLVDKNNISNFLLTGDLGPIDLLIRTGGKHRISNFMLYNLAYAEIYFCDTFWPKFSKKDWNLAISKFNKTVRSFGKVIDG